MLFPDHKMTRISRTPLALAEVEAEAGCALGGGAGCEPRGGLRKRSGLSIKRVEAALRASSGIKALAAEVLDVPRSRIVRFCEKHPRLEAVIAEEADAVIDLAEAKLIEKIRAGDASAIRYYLDNHGGARGYGRKVQSDDGGVAVAINGTDADL